MKSFRIFALAGATAVAAVLAGAALAGTVQTKPTAFSATFNGKAVVRVSGANAEISSVQATGTSVPLGKVTLSGKGAGTQADPCPLFGGRATVSSARGKLSILITPTGGLACTDEGGQDFALSGRAAITGGTGKYAKVKGSFRFSGEFNRGTGLFSVKFKGTFKR